MTEQEAIQRGYHFTGIYKREKEEVKSKVEELRKKGYKAVIVSSLASGYERSAGVRKGMVLGYSVYADERYHADKHINELRRRLEVLPKHKAHIDEEYRVKLTELQGEHDRIVAELMKYGVQPNPRRIRR